MPRHQSLVTTAGESSLKWMAYTLGKLPSQYHEFSIGPKPQFSATYRSSYTGGLGGGGEGGGGEGGGGEGGGGEGGGGEGGGGEGGGGEGGGGEGGGGRGGGEGGGGEGGGGEGGGEGGGGEGGGEGGGGEGGGAGGSGGAGGGGGEGSGMSSTACTLQLLSHPWVSLWLVHILTYFGVPNPMEKKSLSTERCSSL